MQNNTAGNEVIIGDNEIIVSKTNLKGRITYVNDVFRRVSGFSEEDLLSEPHSIVRHPDMPRCIFKLLWDRLGAGEEVFAYVKNRCKNGGYYWVFAHVTPSRGLNGQKVGYHSSRRKPDRKSIDIITCLYDYLLRIERGAPDSKVGMQRAYDSFGTILDDLGVSYDQFIFEFISYFDKSGLESLLSNLKQAS